MSSTTFLPGLAGLLLALTFAGTAAAQSSSANITGDAKAGDTVTIFNPDTGMKREIGVQKDGRFRARSLPTGTYQVTITHADGSISQTHSATLRVGATAFIPADDSAATATLTPSPASPERKNSPDQP